MKDQNNIAGKMSDKEKWNRALDLFVESVHKPDHELRSCAFNQHCYNELIQVRQNVLRLLNDLRVS
jgi:hypothetical protein